MPDNFKSTSARPRQLAPSARRPIVDQVMSMLLTGYEIASEIPPEELERHINSLSGPLRGLVYEGAYARLVSLDLAEKNGGERVNALVANAPATVAQLNAGFGHALSDMTVEHIPDSVLTSFFGWVAIQGLGVHDGYFRWPLSIERQEVPSSIPAWALQGYDEGIGGSLWYICAANPKLISKVIDTFPAHRRPHLWDGVGMLIGYWGMDDDKDMRAMLRYAKHNSPWLQQGVLLGLAGCLYNDAWSDHAEGACNHILRARGVEVIDVTKSAMSQIGEQFTQAHQFVDWKNQLLKKVSGKKLPGLSVPDSSLN